MPALRPPERLELDLDFRSPCLLNAWRCRCWSDWEWCIRDSSSWSEMYTFTVSEILVPDMRDLGFFHLLFFFSLPAVCHDFCMTTGTRHVRKSQTSCLAQSNDWCTGANCTSPSWLIPCIIAGTLPIETIQPKGLKCRSVHRSQPRIPAVKTIALLLHYCTVLEHVAPRTTELYKSHGALTSIGQVMPCFVFRSDSDECGSNLTSKIYQNSILSIWLSGYYCPFFLSSLWASLRFVAWTLETGWVWCASDVKTSETSLRVLAESPVFRCFFLFLPLRFQKKHGFSMIFQSKSIL